MTNDTDNSETGQPDVLGPCPMGLQHPGFPTIEALPNKVQQLEDAVSGLATAVQGKQNALTAGENITIENNVISATGGGAPAEREVFIDELVDLEVGDKVRMYYADENGALAVMDTVVCASMMEFTIDSVSDTYCLPILSATVKSKDVSYLGYDRITVVDYSRFEEWSTLGYSYYSNDARSWGEIKTYGTKFTMQSDFPAAYEALADVPDTTNVYQIFEPASDPMLCGFIAFSKLVTDAPEPDPSD